MRVRAHYEQYIFKTFALFLFRLTFRCSRALAFFTASLVPLTHMESLAFSPFFSRALFLSPILFGCTAVYLAFVEAVLHLEDSPGINLPCLCQATDQQFTGHQLLGLLGGCLTGILGVWHDRAFPARTVPALNTTSGMPFMLCLHNWILSTPVSFHLQSLPCSFAIVEIQSAPRVCHRKCFLKSDHGSYFSYISRHSWWTKGFWLQPKILFELYLLRKTKKKRHTETEKQSRVSVVSHVRPQHLHSYTMNRC